MMGHPGEVADGSIENVRNFDADLCVGISRNSGEEVGSVQEPLIYFTHVVDGRTYGAWYRRISAAELEIFAVGLMRRVSCPEGQGQELAASRAILEEFVRSQRP